jgi:hypothetical protein
VDTAIAASPDGQWIAVRQGTDVGLWPLAGGERAGSVTFASSDLDLAIVGPPTAVIVVERSGGETAVIALEPPGLGETARVTVDGNHDLVTTTGPRLVMINRANDALGVLRCAGRAFMGQQADPGGPVELAAGLDKNQLLLVLAKRIEVWDAVSCRPVLRPSFTLPPPPRRIGPAAGHVWSYQPGKTELVLYRLSDGRPFAHGLGSPIEAVASHPAAPYVVAVTTAGLYRIHAFAHTIETLTAPAAEVYGVAIAPGGGTSATGAPASHVRIIGVDVAGGPWRRPILGDAPAAATAAPAEPTPAAAPARKLEDHAHPPPAAPVPAAGSPAWREALVRFAAELRAGDRDRAPTDVPALPHGTQLATLAQRAQLATPARRALTVLYACYLAGEPAVSIARLAHLIGGDDGWREALGTGELGDRLLVTSDAGRVALAGAIGRFLDGAPPRSIDPIGDAAAGASIVAGAHVMDPDGLGDPVIGLTASLGRFALVTGVLSTAVLEAFAHGLTAVAIAGPGTRLRPVRIPRGGGLVVVAPRAALPPAMASWPTLGR